MVKRGELKIKQNRRFLSDSYQTCPKLDDLSHKSVHCSQPDQPSLWFLKQMLYKPFLWLSLILHGILIMVPLLDSGSTFLDSSSVHTETITLTDLLVSPPSTVPPTLSRSSVLPPVTQPSPAKVAIPPATIPPPVTPSSVQPELLASPTPSATPIPLPEQTPSPTLTPSPTPTITPSPLLEESLGSVHPFFDQLVTITGVPVSLPAPDLFPDASLYFDSVEITPVLKVDILRAVWMEGQTPGQVHRSVLMSQLQSNHLEIEQKPNYGGCTVTAQEIDYAACTVYELRQSETIWYLNLVPTKDGNGTIIVVWAQDPSLPIL